MRVALIPFLLFVIAIPLPAEAIPAINCHCFTDRSYDPSRPGVADPYFLAAAQNSFFSAAFNVEKRTVVMKKQQGQSADDLWVAYWLASHTGTPADALMKMKESKESWKEVMVSTGATPKMVGASFYDAAMSRAPASALAERVVDSLLVRYHFVAQSELTSLRKAGATNQETVMATFVSVKTRQPAMRIYTRVKSGAETWGKIVSNGRIDVTGMQKEMSALMTSRHQAGF